MNNVIAHPSVLGHEVADLLAIARRVRAGAAICTNPACRRPIRGDEGFGVGVEPDGQQAVICRRCLKEAA